MPRDGALLSSSQRVALWVHFFLPALSPRILSERNEGDRMLPRKTRETL